MLGTDGCRLAIAALTAVLLAGPSPSVSAGGGLPPCVGDCNLDGTVTVDEVVTMVNVALGSAPLTACPAGDLTGDGEVTIDEILLAVIATLDGCPTVTPSIALGGAAGFPGDVVNVAATLSSNGVSVVSIAALVIDLDDTALTLLDCGSAVPGKSADVQRPAPGRAAIALSGGLGVIPDGIVLICRLRISDGAGAGTYPLHFVSAVLLDQAFDNVSATGSDGTVSVSNAAQTATATPGQTSSMTPSPTNTQIQTATPTQTSQAHTPTGSSTPALSATATQTATLSASPTLTQAQTPTRSASATATRSATASATQTPTNSLTLTATQTQTPTRSASATATRSATASATRTPTATRTATATPTITPTRSPTATRTPTPTSTPTPSRTSTGSMTPTPTATRTPTRTPTFSPTATPTTRIIDFGPIGAGEPGGGTTIPLILQSGTPAVATVALRMCFSDSDFDLLGCDPGEGSVILGEPEVLEDTCALGDGTGRILAVEVGADDSPTIPSGQFLGCTFGIGSNTTLGFYPVTFAADLRNGVGQLIAQAGGSSSIQVGLDLPTPTPTVGGGLIGPPVLFLGVANFDGCVGCCLPSCASTPSPTPAFDAQGRRIYLRQSGQFALIVEGKPGDSGAQVGTVLGPANPSLRPDLQVQSTRNMGNGSLAVCDVFDGGIPGINPPDFGPSQFITNALRDFACRFGVFQPTGACTKVGLSGNFRTVDPTASIQFCDFVRGNAAFPNGDSLITVQLRDTAGNLGPPAQIVVRVVPPM